MRFLINLCELSRVYLFSCGVYLFCALIYESKKAFLCFISQNLWNIYKLFLHVSLLTYVKANPIIISYIKPLFFRSSIITRVDASTSPTLFSYKRRCSHIRGSFYAKRRRSSHGSHGSHDNFTRHSIRRNRAFSVLSIQSYLYFFWPSTGIEDFDEDIYEDFEEDLEGKMKRPPPKSVNGAERCSGF